MKYFSDVAVFMLVVVFFVLAVIFTPINDDNITGFSVYSSFPGYAVPFSYGSVDTTLVFNDNFDVAPRLFDVYDDIIYRRAYVSYDGQAWESFNLATSSALNGEWIYSRGTASISFTPTKLNLDNSRTVSNNTYIIIYTCSKNIVMHNWSCHDGWQIIKFDARLTAASSTIIEDILWSEDSPNPDIGALDDISVSEELPQ